MTAETDEHSSVNRQPLLLRIKTTHLLLFSALVLGGGAFSRGLLQRHRSVENQQLWCRVLVHDKEPDALKLRAGREIANDELEVLLPAPQWRADSWSGLVGTSTIFQIGKRSYGAIFATVLRSVPYPPPLNSC